MNNTVSSLGKTLQQTAVQKPPQTGQVLNGKVVKLLPQNRAVVQIGGRQVNAQLETSLTKGHNYLFQVGSTENLVQLKVISQHMSGRQPAEFGQLFRELGIKMTKVNTGFLKELLSKEIPFQKSDVKQALALLQQSDGKPAAREVLLQMLQKQLPMKSAIFDALHTRKTTQVSQLLTQIQSSVQGNDKALVDHRIEALIANLKGATNTLSLKDSSVIKLMTEVTTGNQTSFQLFKEAGLIDRQTHFSQFQQSWNQWAGNNTAAMNRPLTDEAFIKLLNQTSNHTPPFPASLEQMGKQLKQVFDQQLPISGKEQQTLKQWGLQLERIITSLSATVGKGVVPNAMNQKIVENHQTLQHSRTLQKIMPFLNVSEQKALQSVSQDFSQLIKNPTVHLDQLRTITTALSSLQSKQLPAPLRQSLTEWVSRTLADFSQGTEKDGILIKMKAMLQLSGMNDEAMMKSSLSNESSLQKEVSLKSLLLQGLQDGNSAIRPETAKQMIHLLNGLHLTAQQETNQSLQMSFQFPGDLLGASRDVHMNMEGRKTSNGEIDPDFCHIVFYLDLENLQETVIDLNIANRRVGVTVFNYDPSISAVVESHQGILKSGLEQLGYELSSLHVRELKANQNKEMNPGDSYHEQDQKRDKGVDIRI